MFPSQLSCCPLPPAHRKPSVHISVWPPKSRLVPQTPGAAACALAASQPCLNRSRTGTRAAAPQAVWGWEHPGLLPSPLGSIQSGEPPPRCSLSDSSPQVHPLVRRSQNHRMASAGRDLTGCRIIEPLVTQPAGHTSLGAAHDLLSLLGCQHTLPAHVVSFVH